MYDPFPAKFETERSDWAPTYQGASRRNFESFTSVVKDRSLRSDGKSAWYEWDHVMKSVFCKKIVANEIYLEFTTM